MEYLVIKVLIVFILINIIIMIQLVHIILMNQNIIIGIRQKEKHFSETYR